MNACYSVKVQPQMAGVNSAKALFWLRDYWIHPSALPADPGAGEHVLRLTLPARLVGKLAEGMGDRPAVALRRLLAGRLRELPAGSWPAPASELRPSVSAAERRRPASRESARVRRWSTISGAGNLAPATGATPAAKETLARAESQLSWRFWFLAALFWGVLLYVAVRLESRARAASGAASTPAARFAPWVPE